MLGEPPGAEDSIRKISVSVRSSPIDLNGNPQLVQLCDMLLYAGPPDARAGLAVLLSGREALLHQPGLVAFNDDCLAVPKGPEGKAVV
jgi:hypothetical protein